MKPEANAKIQLSSTASDNIASPTAPVLSNRETLPEVIHEEILEIREQSKQMHSVEGTRDPAYYIGKRKYGGAGIDLSDDNSDGDNPALLDKSPNTRKQILEESALKKVKLLNPAATFLTLIKGFICTCVLYLPQNFVAAGWGFTVITLIASLFLSLYCAKLILDVRAKLKASSYVDIGTKLFG